MMNEQKKSSGIPLLIIVGVLVLAVVGAYFFYNSSKPKTANSITPVTNSNTAKTPQTATNAPLGAQPPNMIGSPTATVTVEEFADFQCGACASVHPTMKELQSIYGSRIRFIFRNYPLMIPDHDKSYDAAVAAEAAGMQDRNKFWAMQDQLFTNQQTWTKNPNYREIWADYAQKIGLNVERFKNDMVGTVAKTRVDQDLARGRGLSVNSTPTVLVNGKGIPLDLIKIDNLRQMIDSEIQNAIKVQPSPWANAANAPAKPANAAESNK